MEDAQKNKENMVVLPRWAKWFVDFDKLFSIIQPKVSHMLSPIVESQTPTWFPGLSSILLFKLPWDQVSLSLVWSKWSKCDISCTNTQRMHHSQWHLPLNVEASTTTRGICFRCGLLCWLLVLRLYSVPGYKLKGISDHEWNRMK